MFGDIGSLNKLVPMYPFSNKLSRIMFINLTRIKKNKLW